MEAERDYSLLAAATNAFNEGKNVIQELLHLQESTNPSDVDIDLAYELQAGSYIAAVEADLERWLVYGKEIARFLDPLIDSNSSLLDCGTGEMTSLCSTLLQLKHKPSNVLGIDISWSRLELGRRFASSKLPDENFPLPVVADIGRLPLPDSCVDVVTTVHALEPNGGREEALLAELLRVSSKALVLFEPCFERASPQGRERMKFHHYVKGLEATLETLGGEITLVEEFSIPDNDLNPTWVIVATPPSLQHSVNRVKPSNFEFVCPNTGEALVREGDWMIGRQFGLAYPVLKEIPLLRKRHGVLARALD
jgi:hypothetical protein